MTGRISWTVWDFTYCSNKKFSFRLFVLVTMYFFFCRGEISDWYSLNSAVENMCRPRALQMKSPAGELPYEKGGMLVVSIRGVNLGFWSHLGCSVQNAIIFSRKGPF